MRIAHLEILIAPDSAHLVIAPESTGGPDYSQVTGDRDVVFQFPGPNRYVFINTVSEGEVDVRMTVQFWDATPDADPPNWDTCQQDVTTTIDLDGDQILIAAPTDPDHTSWAAFWPPSPGTHRVRCRAQGRDWTHMLETAPGEERYLIQFWQDPL
ncbi:hypothetical protein [Actinomadura opuntiae]|uniref:hypothetical protein n=1 Tax=Actinomadura sp. OS1-43 TaxID=604315 RepID=UPI00255B08FD|nr:hypothetical protein [Actinomadura sp. OS1-43]MDL4817331.1 hypothetical protein [Actinomadura sp. OS1-43]